VTGGLKPAKPHSKILSEREGNGEEGGFDLGFLELKARIEMMTYKPFMGLRIRQSRRGAHSFRSTFRGASRHPAGHWDIRPQVLQFFFFFFFLLVFSLISLRDFIFPISFLKASIIFVKLVLRSSSRAPAALKYSGLAVIG
jgi:hypothetical protein